MSVGPPLGGAITSKPPFTINEVAWQLPLASHASAPSQTVPSEQALPTGFATGAGQPVAGTHAPTVWHWSAPPHVTGDPAVQTPAWQVSRAVQAFPSSQLVPFACFASAGQVVDVPVQVSVTSQGPVAVRQGIPAFPAGCWQVVLTPSQWSVVQGLPSSGQAVPLFPAGCWQVVLTPSQWSVVQGLPSSGQAVPLFPAA